MKKKIIIIFFISISFLLTACTINQEKLYNEQEEKVTETIKDINNISEENIEKSYNYIKNNYSKSKDKTVLGALIYHTKYLEKISNYSSDNSIKQLVTLTNNYLNSSSKENKSKLDSFFTDNNLNKDLMISNLYKEYHTRYTIGQEIVNQSLIVNADINDKNMLTKKNINKAINYLSSHLEKPFENNEITEKIVYYSLFLSNLGTNQNDINKLGNDTINYLKTLNNDDKSKAISSLNIVVKDQERKVSELYEQIK